MGGSGSGVRLEVGRAGRRLVLALGWGPGYVMSRAGGVDIWEQTGGKLGLTTWELL